MTNRGIPNVGEALGSKYRLKRLLGEGGMGRVIEAEHVRLRQPIAIKFLNPSLIGVTEIVQRFDREARAAATLRSRHVVRVTDVEQTPEGVPYMVMELLDGADLESEREARGPLPYDEVVDYVLQACSALNEAHELGIVHRDLKPANLFLAREGDQRIVKILDFGISKFLDGDDAKLTSAGTVMGTALYMSPEQIRCDASIDARSDIWSLGVILYELISGAAPWTGPTTSIAAAIVSRNPPELRARCAMPEALSSAIHAMLEKDAERRPPTIVDVAAALAPFARPGSVGAEVAEQLVRRRQRRGVSPTPADVSGSLSEELSVRRSWPGASSTPNVAATGPRPMAAPPAPSSERSTMTATTQSTMGVRPQPHLIGALAISGVLAIAGIVLIVLSSSGWRTPSEVRAPAPAASAMTELPSLRVRPTSASSPAADPTPLAGRVAVSPNVSAPSVSPSKPQATPSAAPASKPPSTPHAPAQNALHSLSL